MRAAELRRRLLSWQVATLKEDPLWEAMMHDASERRCLVRVHAPISIWFESASKARQQRFERATSDASVDKTTRSVPTCRSVRGNASLGSRTIRSRVSCPRRARLSARGRAFYTRRVGRVIGAGTAKC